MTYTIKEIFYTLQGEGRNAGRPAVFCRFTGCNLWTGREQDRAKAVCQFCDTDFVGTNGLGGGSFTTPESLAEAISGTWPNEDRENRFVVCTGGEPLLQLDNELIECLHEHGFEIAVETNGTVPLPDNLDWVCVSPKANSDVVVRGGDELKFVFPQSDLNPADVSDWKFDNLYLQPMDSETAAANTQRAIEFCLDNPRWKLSLQTHKMLGIP
jgi:7-carboxy-7-deazaguanine synthase